MQWTIGNKQFAISNNDNNRIKIEWLVIKQKRCFST